MPAVKDAAGRQPSHGPQPPRPLWPFVFPSAVSVGVALLGAPAIGMLPVGRLRGQPCGGGVTEDREQTLG